MINYLMILMNVDVLISCRVIAHKRKRRRSSSYKENDNDNDNADDDDDDANGFKQYESKT